MFRSVNKTLLAASVVATLGASAGDSLACGGFFCDQGLPVNQAAERIIFSENGDGTVTAVIQILHQGPSENFSWLLPISSVPMDGDLAVASDVVFQRLQAATNPSYRLVTQIEGECADEGGEGGQSSDGSAGEGGAPGGSGGPVIVEAQGLIGGSRNVAHRPRL